MKKKGKSSKISAFTKLAQCGIKLCKSWQEKIFVTNLLVFSSLSFILLYFKLRFVCNILLLCWPRQSCNRASHGITGHFRRVKEEWLAKLFLVGLVPAFLGGFSGCLEKEIKRKKLCSIKNQKYEKNNDKRVTLHEVNHILR